MSKFRQSNKEPKRQPALGPKEKKAAKQIKQAKSQGAPLSRLIQREASGLSSKSRVF